MAEYSLFWGGQSTGDAANATYGAPYSDDMFSDFFAILANLDRKKDGVIFSMDTRYSGNLGITRPVDHGNATITVGTGAALVDGKLYLNTSAQNFIMTSNGTWQLVLKKDFNAQTVRLVFRQGSTVTQTDGSVWEIELWRFSHTAGLGGGTEAFDKRQFLSLSTGKYLLQQINRQYDLVTPFTFTTNSAWPFKTLRIEWENMEYFQTSEYRNGAIGVRLNGNDQMDYFTFKDGRTPTQTVGSWTFENNSFGYLGMTGTNNAKGYGWAEFPNWNTTDNQKVWIAEGFTLGDMVDTLELGGGVLKVFGGMDSGSAVTQIEIMTTQSPGGTGFDNWAQGSRISLYGII